MAGGRTDGRDYSGSCDAAGELRDGQDEGPDGRDDADEGERERHGRVLERDGEDAVGSELHGRTEERKETNGDRRRGRPRCGRR